METQQETTTETETTNQTQNQPTPTYATYNDYNNGRLTCTPSEQKTIPGTGPEAKPPSPPQYYFQIPLMYNYGTQEKRILNDFLLEFCEMETSLGIQSKQGQSGKMEHSIMCKFDNNNPEQNKTIEVMDQLYLGCAYILGTVKVQVGLRHFNPEQAEATGLKRPVYRPYDKVTGELIQGRAPSMFLKLFSRGKAPYAEQTLFTDITGKPIPWTLLQNVNMKFIPLVHVKRMYIGGGKASIQMEVVSAIVTSISARGSTTRQTDTLQRLQNARPELADTVAAQIAKLTLDRQDQMLGGADLQPQQLEGGTEQPTFAGITSQNRQQQIPQITPTTPSSQGQQPNLPGIPSLGGQQSMQDFTAGAPPRTTTIPVISLPGQSKPNTPPLQFN